LEQALCKEFEDSTGWAASNMQVHITEGWVHFDRMHHKYIGTDRHTKLPHKFVLVKERQKGLALPDLSRLPRSD